jgi:hypothetical protein
MSALTLLAFLFFLHILQQCIKEHMLVMNTPQITIVTGAREGEEDIKKSDAKIDKSGHTSFDSNSNDNDEETTYLMKINTAQPTFNSGSQSYMHEKDFEDRRLAQSGFISAMTD